MTPAFPFGSKAETLQRLRDTDYAGGIPKFTAFRVSEWQKSPHTIVERLRDFFGPNSPDVAIRSSRKIEDGSLASFAGQFKSILNVNIFDDQSLFNAITQVIESYSHPELPPPEEEDEVLVQVMLSPIIVSGVIMTRDIANGGPYYVIEFDDLSGRTDTVTSGTNVVKKVLIHHDVPESSIISQRVKTMVRMARSVEGHCGRIPLDIEFALSDESTTSLFQVRQIAVSHKWRNNITRLVDTSLSRAASFLEKRFRPRQGIHGAAGMLGNMTDWNPAEMIGPRPNPLSESLYRTLITSAIWRDARDQQGYHRVPDDELMVAVESFAYIDIRLSLNSFLPKGLDPVLAEALVTAQLRRLSDKPELHDKVEFEVCSTVADFTFLDDLRKRYPGVLSSAQESELQERLTALTAGLVRHGPDSPIVGDMSTILNFEKLLRNSSSVAPTHAIQTISYLLSLCRHYGTLPFAKLARHGFIAEALWRSTVRRGGISEDRFLQLKRSVRTIAGDMMDDLRDAVIHPDNRPAFLERYGHLRPGAYDILSDRYDKRPEILFSSVPPDRAESVPFQLTPAEIANVGLLLAEAKIPINAQDLARYTEEAVAGREYAKFVFTRAVSHCLELLLEWGHQIGLNAEELNFLAIDDILRSHISSAEADRKALSEIINRRRGFREDTEGLQLNYILRDPGDLYIAPVHRALPTFISQTRLAAKVIKLTPSSANAKADLKGKIVCIEHADPGFDWIFTKGIAGLITQYGGANSHMAVRCAEFGLPAAIGCGELLFSQASAAHSLLLDCPNKRLTPLTPS